MPRHSYTFDRRRDRGTTGRRERGTTGRRDRAARRRFANGETFKCPECGSKVLEQTKYCVSCQKKVEKSAGVSKRAEKQIKHVMYDLFMVGRSAQGIRKVEAALERHPDVYGVEFLFEGRSPSDNGRQNDGKYVYAVSHHFAFDGPDSDSNIISQLKGLWLDLVQERVEIDIEDVLPISDSFYRESSRDRRSKFPKGKPADPTENMTPEQAAEWDEMNERHRDKFKDSARDRRASVDPGLVEVLEEAEEFYDRGAPDYQVLSGLEDYGHTAYLTLYYDGAFDCRIRLVASDSELTAYYTTSWAHGKTWTEKLDWKRGIMELTRRIALGVDGIYEKASGRAASRRRTAGTTNLLFDAAHEARQDGYTLAEFLDEAEEAWDEMWRSTPGGSYHH